MVGSTYRVAIRADGKDPIFSDWITMPDKPRHFPAFVLRPLRTVRGQVVDRRGKPITGVEVFQSGDGPQQTSTRSDTAGRFSLDGFRQGPVFIFARGDGFRFQGRLIKPAETDLTIELTRTSEQPAHEMKMLGDPIPFEESQRLARRLAEPLWALVGADGPINQQYSTLSDLASVDPARVLGLVETAKLRGPVVKARLRREVALALAPSDFEEASAVAESIDDDAAQSRALVDLADTLPQARRGANSPCSTVRCSPRATRKTRAADCFRWATWPSGGLSSARLTRPKISSPRAFVSPASSPTRRTSREAGSPAGWHRSTCRPHWPSPRISTARDSGESPRRYRFSAHRSEPRRSRTGLEPDEGIVQAGGDDPDPVLEDGRHRSGAADEPLKATEWRRPP